ncbi:MAG: hypothetical protein AAFQ37_14180, partial [Bacteroidota bacterium]
QHLRFIGRLGLLIVIISAFNFYAGAGEVQFHFTIPFLPLLFSVGSFVLAQIFTQGKALVEDKNLII